MATRTAGRHRSTKNWSPPERRHPQPPSLLLVDYLESGQITPPNGIRFTSPQPRLAGIRFTAPRPRASGGRLTAPRASGGRLTSSGGRLTASGGRGTAHRASGGRLTPSGGRGTAPRASGGRLTASGGRLAARRGRSVFGPPVSWRMLGMAAPAVIAGVAVAVILGYALLRSPGAGAGRPAGPRSTAPPASSLPPAGTRITPPQGVTGANGSNGANGSKPAHKPGRPHRTAARPTGPRPSASVPPSAAAVPAVAPSRARPRSPGVVASYRVAGRGPAGFQGEVEVTNNGTKPIADWRIVVALPYDQVLSFSNASGLFNNGILLLQPGPGATPIQPGGGMLRVFFAAEGQETAPQACAFNQTLCS